MRSMSKDEFMESMMDAEVEKDINITPKKKVGRPKKKKLEEVLQDSEVIYDAENDVTSNISTRSRILRKAEECVCGQREQDYGSPESNFQLIANLWNDYLYSGEKINFYFIILVQKTQLIIF